MKKIVLLISCCALLNGAHTFASAAGTDGKKSEGTSIATVTQPSAQTASGSTANPVNSAAGVAPSALLQRRNQTLKALGTTEFRLPGTAKILDKDGTAKKVKCTFIKTRKFYGLNEKTPSDYKSAQFKHTDGNSYKLFTGTLPDKHYPQEEVTPTGYSSEPRAQGKKEFICDYE